MVAFTFGALILIGFASLGCAALMHDGKPAKHLARHVRRQKERGL